MMAVVIPWA